MLVVSRHRDEGLSIEFPGCPGRVRISVVEIRGDRCRLGIEAPLDVIVHRDEIWSLVDHDRAAGIPDRPPTRRADREGGES